MLRLHELVEILNLTRCLHSGALRLASFQYTVVNRINSSTIVHMAELYTPRAAADLLGISYPTIKQWLYRGKLSAVKTPGGHYRIHARDIQAFLRTDAPEVPKGKKLTFAISGRNQLVGKIVQVRFDGLLAQVKLSIGGQTVTAIITADAARELELQPGIKAAALIKSTEVMVVRV